MGNHCFGTNVEEIVQSYCSYDNWKYKAAEIMKYKSFLKTECVPKTCKILGKSLENLSSFKSSSLRFQNLGTTPLLSDISEKGQKYQAKVRRKRNVLV